VIDLKKMASNYTKMASNSQIAEIERNETTKAP
jgi:hypothetical protein